MALAADELRPGEKILYIVRHHGLFLFWPILFALVFIASPWVLCWVFDWSQKWQINLGIGAIGVPWLLGRLLVMNTDVWCITDRRLVDKQGIISRKVKESPFEKIHNAEYVQGILGRIFNYGNVEVQTASAEGYSALRMVRDPSRVCKVLMEAVDNDLENKPSAAT